MTRSRTGCLICSVYVAAAQLPSGLHHFLGMFTNLRSKQKVGQVVFYTWWLFFLITGLLVRPTVSTACDVITQCLHRYRFIAILCSLYLKVTQSLAVSPSYNRTLSVLLLVNVRLKFTVPEKLNIKKIVIFLFGLRSWRKAREMKQTGSESRRTVRCGASGRASSRWPRFAISSKCSFSLSGCDWVTSLPHITVLLEKLIVSQTFKNFPTFYEMFITMFTTAHHSTLTVQFSPVSLLSISSL